MKSLERLIQHAKDKVETSQLPPSLYEKAQRRKNAIDSLIIVVIASILLGLSTNQYSGNTTVQSPAVKQYIQQEIVASRSNP